MSKETGGPAFPVVQWETDDDGNLRPKQTNGMTLRDYFAAEAMKATVNAWIINRIYPHDDLDVANNAYVIADAMLKAREQ